MYLDPGFGGMVVQAIVAIVAVGGGIIFSFRKKIRNAFSKNKDNASNNGTNATSRPVGENSEGTEDDVVDTLSENE